MHVWAASTCGQPAWLGVACSRHNPLCLTVDHTFKAFPKQLSDTSARQQSLAAHVAPTYLCAPNAVLTLTNYRWQSFAAQFPDVLVRAVHAGGRREMAQHCPHAADSVDFLDKGVVDRADEHHVAVDADWDDLWPRAEQRARRSGCCLRGMRTGTTCGHAQSKGRVGVVA
eukprot:362878-Chlamydomonas_euryale.AAC.1